MVLLNNNNNSSSSSSMKDGANKTKWDPPPLPLPPLPATQTRRSGRRRINIQSFVIKHIWVDDLQRLVILSLLAFPFFRYVVGGELSDRADFPLGGLYILPCTILVIWPMMIFHGQKKNTSPTSFFANIICKHIQSSALSSPFSLFFFNFFSLFFLKLH